MSTGTLSLSSSELEEITSAHLQEASGRCWEALIAKDLFQARQWRHELISRLVRCNDEALAEEYSEFLALTKDVGPTGPASCKQDHSGMRWGHVDLDDSDKMNRITIDLVGHVYTRPSQVYDVPIFGTTF